MSNPVGNREVLKDATNQAAMIAKLQQSPQMSGNGKDLAAAKEALQKQGVMRQSLREPVKGDIITQPSKETLAASGVASNYFNRG